MRIEIKRGLFWYIRLIAKNGEPLLHSEVYYSKSNATRAANTLAKALRATIVEV